MADNRKPKRGRPPKGKSPTGVTLKRLKPLRSGPKSKEKEVKPQEQRPATFVDRPGQLPKTDAASKPQPKPQIPAPPPLPPPEAMTNEEYYTQDDWDGKSEYRVPAERKNRMLRTFIDFARRYLKTTDEHDICFFAEAKVDILCGWMLEEEMQNISSAIDARANKMAEFLTRYQRNGFNAVEALRYTQSTQKQLAEWRKSPRFMGLFEMTRDGATDMVESALYKLCLAGNFSAIKFWLTSKRPKEWSGGDRQLAAMLQTGVEAGLTLAEVSEIIARKGLLPPLGDVRQAAAGFDITGLNRDVLKEMDGRR